jgi:hypothetical protein
MTKCEYRSSAVIVNGEPREYKCTADARPGSVFCTFHDSLQPISGNVHPYILEVVDITEQVQLDLFRGKMEQIIALWDRVNSVRIGIDAEGVKFSLNHGTWSPGLGKHE